jgi:hypothetical protein
MPTHFLDVDYSEEFDFTLVGIASGQREHRLVWSVNTAMGWMLERSEDAEITRKTGKSYHARFRYMHPEDRIVYTLFANRGEGGLILPEWVQFGYLLKVENDPWIVQDALCRSLRKSQFVQAAIELPAEKVKSIHQLILG